MKYAKAAVAVTLTSHLDALLAEASRFAARFDAPLTVIHAGPSEAESGVISDQPDPAEAIMTASAQAGIDLLVVGAFEGPAFGKRRFLGATAQTLARRAECSLLLVAHPRVEEHRFRRIVALTDFSESSRIACEEAVRVAEKDGAESIHIVSIHTVFMEARARMGENKEGRTFAEKEILMDRFVKSLPAENVPLESRVLRGTTGFAGCDFADSLEADLLVLPGHHRKDGRITPMVDWTLRVLPCSLWIVHHGPVWTTTQSHL
jgi:nucleotide-binding universal stress UspA family protein